MQHYKDIKEMMTRYDAPDSCIQYIKGLIIMGASRLTGSLISKYPSFILHWVSFAILLAAIFYLLVSGIDAIRVYSFVNTNKNYYVQYQCFGAEIIIKNFLCFDKVIDE